MEVVFLLSAEQDLQKAYIWVEEHRHGREQIFLRDLELQLEQLKRFPLVGRIYRGPISPFAHLKIPLLVSSTLPSPTGLLFTRSLISAKILKGFRDAFQNRTVPLDLPVCWNFAAERKNSLSISNFQAKAETRPIF